MDQNNGGIIGKINTPTTTVASGVWSLDSQFESQSGSTWPLAFPQVTLANACRFDDASDDSLTKTFSSAVSTRQQATVSMWVKLGNIDHTRYLFECSDGANPTQLYISSGNKFAFYDTATNSTFETNTVLRDVSAWYHLVCRVDTTQSSNSDRVKLYINGVLQSTSTTNTLTQNNNILWGKNSTHTVGKRFGSSDSFDGYIAEFVFIMSSSLNATSFGVFNPVTNIWEPRPYAGTYSTNGFRLDFADSSDLGNDVSGLNNDFTVNNLTSVDQSTDTCSNNFETLNPLNATLTNSTLTEGNLQFAGGSQSSPNYAYVSGTMAPSQGKWYWEVKAVDNAEIDQVGVALASSNFAVLANSNGLQATTYGGKSVQLSNGNKAGDGAQSSYMGGFSANDIMMIALDLDNGNIYFGRNGQWADGSGSADQSFPGTAAFTNLTSGEAYFPAHAMRDSAGNNSGESEYNFGSPPFSISSGNADANGFGNFEYSVPSGYFALCTKNLAEFG